MKERQQRNNNDCVRQFSSDKILKHLDRVCEWLEEGNPAPITVELDVTNVCNHKCRECACGYFRVEDCNTLDSHLCDNIITQLCEAGTRGIIFTGGGEPLCHKHTPDAVKLVSELGVDIGFITNGELLTEEIAEVLLRSSVWIRVSLDAATPETFKIIHGKGEESFNKVIENIATLARMKKEMNSKTTVGVGFLTCNETRDEMYDAAQLCKEMGVDYLQYRPMQISHNGKFDYHWTDVEKKIESALTLSDNNFKVLYSKHKYDMMHDKNYGRNYGKCYGHQFATVVAATGKMYICCHFRGHEKYCIGDLKKNTFEEIWNSEKRLKAIEAIDFRECMPLCRDNTFNQVLWNLKQPKDHVNFL